nr:fimbrillin family protein [Parabacteroides goldsteinii]
MKTGYIILLILLFAACRDQADLPDKETRYPVSFTLPEIAAMTRGTVAEETVLAADDKVTVAAYNPNTKAFVAQTQYKVNTAGNGLELDNSSDMFLSAGTYDFCAIVPGQTLTGDGRSGRIRPQVDALGSTTRAQMRSEATTIALDNLKHLASQIKFTVRVVKNDTPITAFNVVQIEIEDMVTYTDAQGDVLVDNYRLPENELIIPGADETDRYAPIYILNEASDPTFDYHLTDPDGRTGKHYNIQKEPLIVYPRTNGSFKANIRLNIAENNGNLVETNVSAKINHLAFEPGKRYLFEVNYGWDFVKFTVTVSPWTTVDNDQGQVGSGEQEVKSTFRVDEWGNLVELGGDMGGA